MSVNADIKPMDIDDAITFVNQQEEIKRLKSALEIERAEAHKWCRKYNDIAFGSKPTDINKEALHNFLEAAERRGWVIQLVPAKAKMTADQFLDTNRRVAEQLQAYDDAVFIGGQRAGKEFLDVPPEA